MGSRTAGRGAGGGFSCDMYLLVYWLCCCMWYEDKSDNSSGRHSTRMDVGHDTGGRRRSGELFTRRFGTSAVSLHLPSTSGHKKPLSAHRSHEEIGRRKSHHENNEETRYHSAPSVIDEVLHRRDWERSTKDLYIPLKPVITSGVSDSPEEAPRAVSESSSIEVIKTDEQIVKPCKKHFTNIKSSKGRKEKETNGSNSNEKECTRDDIKDCDATELTGFYIGESQENDPIINDNNSDMNKLTKSDMMKTIYKSNEVQTKICKAKEVKQSLNESIRSKDRPRQTLVPLEENQPRMLGFYLDDVIEQLESLDRSGAMHHSIESRVSSGRSVFPPPSVEPVGYDGGACYLGVGAGGAGGAGASGGGGVDAREGGMRARHSSDGDILAPHHRPESGAFSESELELELEASEERPPAYDELHHYATLAPERKETAI